MRRKDKAIADLGEQMKIIDDCKVCRLGLYDGSEVYIVPLNFGYELSENKLTLYFHCAKEGRKIDILRHNSKAAFEMDCAHELVEDVIACKNTYKYSSVIGNGIVEFLNSSEEKINAFKLIMKHQTGKDFEFNEKMVGTVAIIKLTAESFTAKQN